MKVETVFRTDTNFREAALGIATGYDDWERSFYLQVKVLFWMVELEVYL